MRTTTRIILGVFVCVLIFATSLHAQNTYELRKLTDEDWLRMTTEERLNALGTTNSQASNQTFVGDFGRSRDLYPRWGYDYYEMEDRYENYAFRGFENYNIIEDRRNRWYYNQFGDRLTKMTRRAQIWSERKNDDGTWNVDEYGEPLDYITPEYFINSQTAYDGIWVARESTDDWAVSVVGAAALRVKLTPLTVSLPGMHNGMAVDFQSANNTARFINSVQSGQHVHIRRWGCGIVIPNMKDTIILRGFQFRRKIGALTLGTTYANMYAMATNHEGGDTLKGTVNDFMPTPARYALRIMDDSPHDGDGPIIHDVKIKVNGVYRPDLVPQVWLDDIGFDLSSAADVIPQSTYNRGDISGGGLPTSGMLETDFADQYNLHERIPHYLDYIYMNQYLSGTNTKNMTNQFSIEKGKEYFKLIDPGGKPYQVNGNEYATYLFDITSITDEVRSVEAEVTVANDYKIQTSEIYALKPDAREDPDGAMMNQYYNSTYWTTRAQADGNIKDGSNLRTVTVPFAYEVGNLIYGFDAHFNYLGFKIDGEFVFNTHNYMYSEGVPGSGVPISPSPDISPRTGARFSQTDNAYYLVAQKDWQRFGFVGEFFKMGKYYRPHMMWFAPNNKLGSQGYTRNNTTRLTMIEDNDDDDQYADLMLYAQAMGPGFNTALDPDGVFPGLDEDRDGIPDTDINVNGVPDYYEPFLMFDVDPDEFAFGDDRNNNTVPDFREDDLKYDTPYDLDRQGRHLYLRFTPQRNINLMAGTLRTRGVGMDTRTYDDYLKVNLNYDVFTVGNIFGEYRYEEIQDNIRDRYFVTDLGGMDVSQLAAPPTHGSTALYTNTAHSLYYDEVEYRNSKVNKFFLESKLRAIPSVTVENHIRYEHNHQLEGVMYDNTFQPDDTVTMFAMSNKFAYTRQLGNWTFSPGVKFRLYKKGYVKSLQPRDHYMLRIPLVYVKYRVSPKTNITLGLQGFKGMEMLYKDYIQGRNDYKQKNFVLQIENRTNYFGFEVWGGFGFMVEDKKFEEIYRHFESYKTSSFFVRMWLGY